MWCFSDAVIFCFLILILIFSILNFCDQNIKKRIDNTWTFLIMILTISSIYLLVSK